MPFSIPSLVDLRRINRDALAGELSADALLPKSPARALSDQNAGGAWLNLLYLEWQARQYLPDTAESEWLDRHGQIWLGGRKSATYASGVVGVTGTAGVLLPTGTLLATIDGVRYQTKDQVYVSGAVTPVAVDCLTPGVVGNRDVGSGLYLSVAVAGVDALATILAMAGGTDAETDEELRARVLLRIRKPPMGGDADDYEQWTLSVPGVTRAWVSPREMGIGTVTVRFMADHLRASTGGFPNQSDIDAVRAYLDTVRPVAVKDFFVVAPIRQPYEVTIRNLSRNSPSTRIAIEKALIEMEAERSVPGGTLYASWQSEAVSGALGEDHHDGLYANVVPLSPGHMPTLANVHYS